METVDRRGLKSRFLGKHRGSVDRFYKHLTANSVFSDAAKKVVDRLKKNQKTLFTFLDYDDVPCNNNNAEHAIKAFAMLRHVIEGVTTKKGTHEYLVLLSVCETDSAVSDGFGSTVGAAFRVRRRKGTVIYTHCIRREARWCAGKGAGQMARRAAFNQNG